MKIRQLLTILTALLIMTGCSRTMMLNQTATTLDKGEKETAGSAASGVTVAGFVPGPLLALGLQHRVGLRENLEFQFRFESNCHFIPTGAFQFTNHADWYFKLRALNAKKIQLSFLPYFGIKQHIGITDPPSTWSPTEKSKLGLGVGPTFGLKTVISHDLPGKKVSIYYGAGLDISENLLLLANLYESSGYSSNLPFMDLTIGLSMGFELPRRVVTRHEFGLSVYFDLATVYSPQEGLLKNITMDGLPCYTFSYMFAIGGRYGEKYNNMQQERSEEKRKIDWSE